MRADHAAEKLQAMVSNIRRLWYATAKRNRSIAQVLVPGDIIRLAAGRHGAGPTCECCPAKDLFLNQATLTGEALPVEKKATPAC